MLAHMQKSSAAIAFYGLDQTGVLFGLKSILHLGKRHEIAFQRKHLKKSPKRARLIAASDQTVWSV